MDLVQEHIRTQFTKSRPVVESSFSLATVYFISLKTIKLHNYDDVILFDCISTCNNCKLTYKAFHPSFNDASLTPARCTGCTSAHAGLWCCCSSSVCPPWRKLPFNPFLPLHSSITTRCGCSESVLSLWSHFHIKACPLYFSPTLR